MDEPSKLRNNTRNHSRVARDRARSFRKEPSKSEEFLWSLIRKKQLGFGFKRQVTVGPYVLDFYCPEARVCVEVDGEQHQITTQRDADRDEHLRSVFIETIRISTVCLWEQDRTLVGRELERVVEVCEVRSGRKFFDGR